MWLKWMWHSIWYRWYHLMAVLHRIGVIFELVKTLSAFSLVRFHRQLRALDLQRIEEIFNFRLAKKPKKIQQNQKIPK